MVSVAEISVSEDDGVDGGSGSVNQDERRGLQGGELKAAGGWLDTAGAAGRERREKRGCTGVGAALRGEGVGLERGGGGAENQLGSFLKKQKEILYFLLCRVSQFPILEKDMSQDIISFNSLWGEEEGGMRAFSIGMLSQIICLMLFIADTTALLKAPCAF